MHNLVASLLFTAATASHGRESSVLLLGSPQAVRCHSIIGPGRWQSKPMYCKVLHVPEQIPMRASRKRVLYPWRTGITFFVQIDELSLWNIDSGEVSWSAIIVN